ncbi:isocitrate/isopropylmalate family dehydrogenase [Picrophilus oshimae]|uniref:isocitrate dehydrogenase (NADP(+)) n=1 Tax=Picrophilus torridus (strain ATCC 700027 / DSM 9790 / JCM 10055 / NBRC 100828 / KAW 2/3) TaxID=1122961 RepID=Q6L1Z1_PICTO|nr:isocitrate/isopropylmalate family dehydrogenase [Picrophilus oshimae]AAT43011.1 isocitrate dehydrogenase [NADP] [Picrophilus oshimae DSM 9789]
MYIKLDGNHLIIPDDVTIGYIEGDGEGTELTRAMINAVNSAIEIAYSGSKSIEWKKIYIGREAYEKYGKYLPRESIEDIRKTVFVMKGPLSSNINGHDININIKRILNLYTDVKCITGLPGLSEGKEIFIFSPSIDEVYHFSYDSEDSDMLRQYLQQSFNISIGGDSDIFLKGTSRYRIIKIASKIAEISSLYGIKRTLVADDYTGSHAPLWVYNTLNKMEMPVEIENLYNLYDEMTSESRFNIFIPDSRLSSLIIKIINARTFFGAILGDFISLFESQSRPSFTEEGYDLADPTSFLLASSMMLRRLNFNDAALILRNALNSVYSDGILPASLNLNNGLKCSDFIDAIVKRMKR